MSQLSTQVAMSVQDHIDEGKKAPSISIESDDKRRFKRVSVLWSGEYADDQGGEQKCVIYDVSVNGVRAKFDHVIEIGAKLVIKIAGGVQLLSEVVWSRGETVGLRFKDSPEKLASIMAGVLPTECLEFA